MLTSTMKAKIEFTVFLLILIAVSGFAQTSESIPSSTREFKVEKRYLNIPIKNGAIHKRVVTILVGGKIEVRDEIELADAAPDWWALIDVSAWLGKTVTFHVDTKLPLDSTALSSIEQSDTIKDGGNLYHEPLRAQFHFSSRRGWNNDPNGLVFYKGEYHLFYQHNPYGWAWGNMHWGHAVSPDLVHWRELGDVLAPDTLGDMFSGSAVVDWKNTSGLGTPGQPPLILIYTSTLSGQSIASSTDGRNFTKFSANPVVKNITGAEANRDPKVYWHEPTQRWVMALYVGLPGKECISSYPEYTCGNLDNNGRPMRENTIYFLMSPNLKDWTVTSHVEGFYECPDYFELPVDGDLQNQKWVLTAASSEYMIGSFDGQTFQPETRKLPGHRGRGFYAAQTFSDLPDGRRIQIGWFQTETKGMPFNQSMTIPLELKLVSTPAGPRLTRTPVKELEKIRAKTYNFSPMTLHPDSANPLLQVKAELVELRTEFEPGNAKEVILTVRGATIVYDAEKQELQVNGQRADAPLVGGKQRLVVFVDRVGLEVFASDGLTYMPMPFIPKAEDLGLGIQAKGGDTKINTLQVNELNSIWK
jgi:fructan beta-fructosidase